MTSGEAKSKYLVPRLRFPEFRDEGEWEVKIISQVASLHKGKGISKSDIVADGNQECIRYGELYTSYGEVIKEVTSRTNIPSSELFLSKKNDVIIPGSGETKIDIATASCVTKNNIALGGDLNIIRSKHNGIFLSYLFNGMLRNKIAKIAQGDTVVHLYRTQLELLEIPLPVFGEQQKIADCLSSLDELITAESQKLESFKAHKKGLMQKLFLVEGEIVPELRFPEFRHDGEWERKKLKNICRFVRGPFGAALKKEIFVKSGYAVYEQSHAIYKNFKTFRYFITEEKFNELKRFSVKPGDIIMSCSGTMGKFAIVPKKQKKGVINQALLKLTVDNNINIYFFKFSFELPSNQENLLSQSAGGAIKNVVGVNQLKEIILHIPKLKEQQKIADCLSSLDELITAQGQKIEALKAHKKGLMQGLFPSADEVRV